MTEELKSAIRTIATYDGTLDADVNDDFLQGNFYRYAISADALLPVWRRVKDTHPEHKLIKWNMYTASPHETAGHLILHGDLESACLKLAEIISQLNEQK